MSVISEVYAGITEADQAFFAAQPQVEDSFLAIEMDIAAGFDKITKPTPEAADEPYFSHEGSWIATRLANKPIEPFNPKDIEWITANNSPASSEVKIVDVNAEAETPMPTEAPKSLFARTKDALKTLSLTNLRQKTSEWISKHRTEVVSYAVGSIATLGAGYYTYKGIGDLHLSETFADAAHTLLDLERTEQPLAQASASEHFSSAGLAASVSAAGFGTGAVVSHAKKTAAQSALATGVAPRRAYSVERPQDYYYKSPGQQHEQAQHLSDQAAYLNTLRHLPKPPPTVYYSDSFAYNIDRPSNGVVYYSSTFEPITDPEIFTESIRWPQPSAVPEYDVNDYSPKPNQPPAVDESFILLAYFEQLLQREPATAQRELATTAA